MQPGRVSSTDLLREAALTASVRDGSIRQDTECLDRLEIVAYEVRFAGTCPADATRSQTHAGRERLQ